MSRYDNTKRNQYNSTPRKVFDTYCDKMAVKRTRDRSDHRADMGALLQKLDLMQQQLDQLQAVNQLVDSDLVQLPDGRWRRKHSTGEP